MGAGDGILTVDGGNAAESGEADAVAAKAALLGLDATLGVNNESLRRGCGRGRVEVGCAPDAEAAAEAAAAAASAAAEAGGV